VVEKRGSEPARALRHGERLKEVFVLQTLLFFHILGVVGLFVGLAIELLAIVRLQRAETLADARAATLNVPVIAPLMGTSVLLLLSMGIAMVYVGGFGWSQGWIDVVFAVVVAFAIAAPILVGRKLEALHAMAAEGGDGPITAAIERARRGALAQYLVFFGLLATVSALYVMISKPALPQTIALVVAAAAIAVVPTALVLKDGAPAPLLVSPVSSAEEEEPASIG
jgi:uncharacterized membrane protein